MYKVFDLETQTHVHMKRKASPFHPDNYIVATGWKNEGDDHASYLYSNNSNEYQHLVIEESITMLVGFNLKFDLLWQWSNPQLQAFFKRGGVIWDCQYVEYLLQGQDQRFHFPDLSTVSQNYGGTAKIDEVKLLWEAGVQTSDICKDLLIDYLVGTEEEGRNAGDIGNTERVFLAQRELVQAAGMLKAVQSRMDGLLCTTEMEYNGLKIDIKEAKKQLKELTDEKETLRARLPQYLPKLPPELEFKWTSNAHKSCIIFGGAAKYVKKCRYTDPTTGELARYRTEETHWITEDGSVPETDGEPPANVVRFKGGKKRGYPKTRKVKGWGEYKERNTDFHFVFPGHITPLEEWKTKNTDALGKPYFKTNADVIATLENSDVPFLKDLTRYEAINKEIGTYFVMQDNKGNLTGMLTCVDPVSHKVHHKLNHTSTVTARLSSSDPNLQNIPRADKSNIKKIFISRFHNGVMLEVDYSQLEVVVQGVLSGDPQLCQDLVDRIDFHCKRISIQPKYDVTYDEVKAICSDEAHPDHKHWKGIRTLTKTFSFQRAYGAGAALIAKSTGMSVEDVKELIAAEEETYPGVLAFNENVETTVKLNAEPFKDFSLNADKVYRRGKWQAPTGCLYTFRSFDAPDFMQDKGVPDTFSPTQMKNYPVQGTGGEIVQGMCGVLWRHFVNNNNYGGKAVLVNTVHDCVWVDCDSSIYKQVSEDVCRILEGVQEWFRQFGVEITVPFPVDAEAGPNMLDLKHIH